MKKILFVDDEANILQGLKRMLRPMRKEWEMHFAGGGKEALELLKNTDIDIVVSDMRMPEMDGAQLLTEVKKIRPRIVRIVLSGHSDLSMVLKSVMPAHQYISKPCTPDKLKFVIERATNLRKIIENESVQSLLSGIETLPALPKLYFEVEKELGKESASLEKVGDIISQDVGMTAKILKLVNSSFFGFARHISSPQQAVTLLGINIIKSLVLSTHIFSTFDADSFPDFSLEGLWEHSMATATLAKAISSNEEQNREMVDESFMSGLLHDVGKLILASHFTKEYTEILNRVREENRRVWELEKEILQTSHAEIGAYLMGLWGLPDSIVEAIAFHHQPVAYNEDFQPLTAVHAANVMEHTTFVINKGYKQPELDMDYLKKLGLAGRAENWKKLCEQTGRGSFDKDNEE